MRKSKENIQRQLISHNVCILHVRKFMEMINGYCKDSYKYALKGNLTFASRKSKKLQSIITMARHMQLPAKCINAIMQEVSYLGDSMHEAGEADGGLV